MIEKINREIALNKKEKISETIKDLSKNEIVLLKKMQENVPEDKKKKFKKIGNAFLAITAGALMLSNVGCGVPFMIGMEAKNAESISSVDVLLGPLAHPSYFFERSPEMQVEDFVRGNVFLTIFNFHNTWSIYRGLRRSGWSKVETENRGDLKYCMEIEEDKFEKESFSIVLLKGERTEASKKYGWLHYEYTEDKKIEKVSYGDLLETVEKMISSVNK